MTVFCALHCHPVSRVSRGEGTRLCHPELSAAEPKHPLVCPLLKRIRLLITPYFGLVGLYGV